jgi:hypothetical protein
MQLKGRRGSGEKGERVLGFGWNSEHFHAQCAMAQVPTVADYSKLLSRFSRLLISRFPQGSPLDSTSLPRLLRVPRLPTSSLSKAGRQCESGQSNRRPGLMS